ncbi:hypothetical protein CYMTET_3532 [Cymbomonas tetramitiformis]|uniref:Uncharacterized protein n=1 Tax=Cymbomonas tetramitiformis TaxID=36881 RepID=A0AAE0H358_9CHLO|nr:hypothetical protein CYMTET_3532 [Cymbomonas tetramitiformis]
MATGEEDPRVTESLQRHISRMKSLKEQNKTMGERSWLNTKSREKLFADKCWAKPTPQFLPTKHPVFSGKRPTKADKVKAEQHKTKLEARAVAAEKKKTDALNLAREHDANFGLDRLEKQSMEKLAVESMPWRASYTVHLSKAPQIEPVPPLTADDKKRLEERDKKAEEKFCKRSEKLQKQRATIGLERMPPRSAEKFGANLRLWNKDSWAIGVANARPGAGKKPALPARSKLPKKVKEEISQKVEVRQDEAMKQFHKRHVEVQKSVAKQGISKHKLPPESVDKFAADVRYWNKVSFQLQVRLNQKKIRQAAEAKDNVAARQNGKLERDLKHLKKAFKLKHKPEHAGALPEFGVRCNWQSPMAPAWRRPQAPEIPIRVCP